VASALRVRVCTLRHARADPGRAGEGGASRKVKTSIVIDDALLQRLKHAALDERTDVSSLLARLAADYLAKRSR